MKVLVTFLQCTWFFRHSRAHSLARLKDVSDAGSGFGTRCKTSRATGLSNLISVKYLDWAWVPAFTRISHVCEASMSIVIIIPGQREDDGIALFPFVSIVRGIAIHNGIARE